ncbi:O-acetyl-ADP-ribose deacetylase [Agromyces mangrovi Wang et al. 2018]|uniref:O-acetyl-ADP-ribose deacetylase n=1 Tax=Agromyces mangrovi TaxID=1858653 RepID=UPI002573209C|nr:O-acetyl-ADP-ribose deacetylase [Agromyces mangrovi]BDZ65997.1 macro domain-containing protein [Agromyces mangrovi]
MPRLQLVTGDLTRERVDAIVNAANSSLLGGGGVDGAIHRAGGPSILEECRALRESVLVDGLGTGEAVATTAGLLDAQWVIHTVGPVWPGPGAEADARRAQLTSAYRSSLFLAAELGAESIAFPAISAGAYGWPLADAARVAVEAVSGASDRPDLVRFVLFSASTHAAFAQAASDASVDADS